MGVRPKATSSTHGHGVLGVQTFDLGQGRDIMWLVRGCHVCGARTGASNFFANTPFFGALQLAFVSVFFWTLRHDISTKNGFFGKPSHGDLSRIIKCKKVGDFGH